jgi:hypothetical protein
LGIKRYRIDFLLNRIFFHVVVRGRDVHKCLNLNEATGNIAQKRRKMFWKFTLRSFNCRQKVATLFGPLTLELMALLRSSSNVIRAAEWKTTETFATSSCMSENEMPRSGKVTSPLMGIIFLRASG